MNPTDLDDREVDGFLALLLRHGHDFRNYARASLLRRLSRALDVFGARSPSELGWRIVEEPSLVQDVVDALTVQITEMFRDPSFFLALRRVMPVLATWPSIKAWVAGCATGEEAWSVAVLLDEAGLLDRSLIYATDISERALEFGRQGRYPLDRIAVFADNHRQSGATRPLTEYLHPGADEAEIDERLRRRVVFAEHSLATDHVFSEAHLVTCRNVLIYFDVELQERAVGLFRDALVHGGFLGLGSKESLRHSAYAAGFEPVDRPNRLFRRVE